MARESGAVKRQSKVLFITRQQPGLVQGAPLPDTSEPAAVLQTDYLPSALAKFQLQLGAQCVVSTAGGGLNGTLLGAALVDELHIITVPALTGGLGTPSIIDGPPLEPGELPVPPPGHRCPGRHPRLHLGALRSPSRTLSDGTRRCARPVLGGRGRAPTGRRRH